MNVYEWFRDQFGRTASRIFIDQPGRPPVTYAEADRIVRSLSAALLASGARPGDRVVVRMEKSAWLVFMYLACLRSGLVFVPIDHRAPAADARRVADDAEPVLVVQGAALDGDLAGSSCRHTLNDDGSGSLAELAPYAADVSAVDVGTEHPAVIIYTSGTTGRPKGVVWSHGFIRANARLQFEQWRLRPEDVFLHAVPMFHAHGLSVALNSVLMAGSRLRLLPRFRTDTVIDELPACTVFTGVPTMYVRLLSDPRLTRERCRAMRLFLSGSAALPATAADEFEARTGHRILECYGMTETGTLTSSSLSGERRRGTVGKALPAVELRVTSAGGETLPVGEIGELQVRKAPLFSGYWRRPDETAALYTADDFFRTGDLAVIDEQGYVRIVGRSKEVIVTGGFKVYPREVEAALGRLHGVRQCLVLGVPDPCMGEVVAAMVVLDPDAGADADQQSLRVRLQDELAPHKLPRLILRVSSIPNAASGKVDVNRAREMCLAAYNKTSTSSNKN